VTQCIDEGVLRAFIDDALSEAEREGVEAHLARCHDCAARLEELRTIAAQVSALLVGSAPSPDTRAAFARVRAEANTDRVASYFANRRVSTLRPVAPEPASPGSQRTPRRLPAQLRYVLSGVSVAAVILIALGLAGLLNPPDSMPPPVGTTTGTTTSSTAEIAPRVGYVAPDFTLLDVKTNQPVSLSSLRGKPVLINFWGTWCPPCREEMPIIQALYEKYAGQVEIVGVSMGPRDYPEQVISFVNQYNYTWTFLHDPDMTVMSSYIVQGIPASYFIDRAGVIRSITVGGSPASLLERELLKVITQAPVPVETTIIVEEPLIFTPTPAPISQVDPVDPPRMPLEEFKALYDDPATRPLILDVRAKEAYDEGHIAGAVSFPEADVDTRVSELPKDRLIIAYCQ
jgi:thiol-disulfide isomerase/thioredoxin